MRHRTPRSHAATIVVLGIVLVAADALLWLVRTWPLLLAAVVLVAGYRRGWHHRLAARPARQVLPGRVLPDRTAGLEAENAELRARLADAEESAHAAWDAASSVPPRPTRADSNGRDRLLSDRLGGVHDLWQRP